MDRYLEEISHLVNRDKYLPAKLINCTLKMLPFSYDLSQLPPPLMAASTILALIKIQQLKGCDSKELLRVVCEVGGVKGAEVGALASTIVQFVKNFDKQFHSFRNLKLLYLEEYKTLMKLTSSIPQQSPVSTSGGSRSRSGSEGAAGKVL